MLSFRPSPPHPEATEGLRSPLTSTDSSVFKDLKKVQRFLDLSSGSGTRDKD